MKKKQLLRYENKFVQVGWRDPDDDWPYFTILKVKKHRTKIRGEDYPNGYASHDHGRFWVCNEEFVTIKSA